MYRTLFSLIGLILGIGFTVASHAEDSLVYSQSALQRKLNSTSSPNYDDQYTDIQGTEASSTRQPASEVPEVRDSKIAGPNKETSEPAESAQPNPEN